MTENAEMSIASRDESPPQSLIEWDLVRQRRPKLWTQRVTGPSTTAMQGRLIYLDTSIWNVLADQTPDENDLCHKLLQQSFAITLGLNSYYELLWTFFGDKPTARRRGQRLFTCVHRFLRCGVHILKTWEKLLIEEAEGALGKAGTLIPFEARDFEETLRIGARELSCGRLGPEVEKLAKGRDAQNQRVRNSALQYLQDHPEVVSDLKSIGSANVADFLDTESRRENGSDSLASYLETVFRDFYRTMPIPAQELAAKLLESTANHAAHALVRCDIYQNWRAANKRTLNFRECIPDDSYHVANASYCDVFVTEDKDGQAEAARLAVPGINVLVYENRDVPISAWLPESLATIAIG